MDELIADQIEWLLGNYGTSNRLGRQLITLTGFLGSGAMPENILRQTGSLSKLIMLQDAFDSLTQVLNSLSKSSLSLRADTKPGEQSASQEPAKLLEQIESVRREIAGVDPVNYSELIAWIVGQAREQKILRSRARR